MKLQLLTLTSLFSISLIFSGCGDQLNTKSRTTKYRPSLSKKTGFFIDSGVEGSNYTRLSGTSDITGKGGSYTYNYGETITFKIGNLVIGETLALGTVTPKEIVSFENLELNTSINAPDVNNRVRMLMSLDSDGIAANGIEINTTIQTISQNWSTPDYSLPEANFTDSLRVATNNYPMNIVSKNDAKLHFEKTLRCVYSGAYRGSWVLPSGGKEGFVGILIQADGAIIALGDGQDTNGDGDPSEVLYASGTHNMDTGRYDFNETYEFDTNQGRIVGSDLNISGDGSSNGYLQVAGTFEQNGIVGSYNAFRVGEGTNVSYRYSGFGYLNNDGSPDDANDSILGLFTFDINRDGSIIGMIHDARTNEEPDLVGDINFTTNIVNISVESGAGHTLNGTIDFNDINSSLYLEWDDNSSNKLGYIKGIGCQLQTHD